MGKDENFREEVLKKQLGADMDAERSEIVNGYELTIEPALFGDYWVAVYDDRQNLLLDKKYFVNSYAAACFVFDKLKSEYEKK